MPIYLCRNGKCKGGTALLSNLGDLPPYPDTVKCETCGAEMPQTGPVIGRIDGPTIGYFGPETGWPLADPGRSIKRVCPSDKGKGGWKEHIRASKDTATPYKDYSE